MTQASAAIFKIPTDSPQPARKAGRPARRAKPGRPAPGRVLANGTGRAATRGGGEVIELEYGITVYPAREEKGRWRAVWHENGQRQQCEAGTEQKLTAKLEKVTERLAADAPDMKRPGADLIRHYLDPDRLPVDERWSRKHADTQRRLCERFAAPVIAAVTCQDIKTDHTQKIVNAAPTAGEGNRVHRMISALVSAGLEAGYLANPRLAKVHWQAGDRRAARPAGDGGGGIGAVGRPRRDPVLQRHRRARPGAGRRAARRAGRADGQHRRLQRAAVGRACRAHHPPGRPGRPGDHGGPQGGRGRRAPVRRGAQVPEVPPDDLPAPHA